MHIIETKTSIARRRVELESNRKWIEEETCQKK